MLNSMDHNFLLPEIPAGDDWLPPSEVATLTPEIVKQRIIEIQPLIRENARKAELLRRPVTEVISAIRKTGFFYLMVPQAYGGMGATPNDLLDVATPIAEACMSTAWVCSFIVNHNWVFSHFSKEAHQETWGSRSPYMMVPVVSNPPAIGRRVEGGYRVSGRWKWGSGVMHADWVIGMTQLDTDGDPAIGLALFPVEDVKIIDTWHSDGLCGTGSHDILVEDIFVAQHRTVFIAPILEGKSGAGARFGQAIYGMPMVPFLSFAGSIPGIGAAKAAVAAVARRHSVHTRIGDSVAQVEKPLSQARLARADLMVRTGEILIRQVGRELLEYQSLPDEERIAARLRWRAQVAEGMHLCHQAAQMASASAGSSLHFLDNPLQRILRDLSVQSTHYAFDQDAAQEQYGRELVGLPPTSFLY